MNKKIIAFTLALLATSACQSPSEIWESVTGLRPEQPVSGAKRTPVLNAQFQRGTAPVQDGNSPYSSPMLTQVAPATKQPNQNYFDAFDENGNPIAQNTAPKQVAAQNSVANSGAITPSAPPVAGEMRRTLADNNSTPQLSAVPAVPKEFETARESASQNMQDLQADRQIALQEKQNLSTEIAGGETVVQSVTPNATIISATSQTASSPIKSTQSAQTKKILPKPTEEQKNIYVKNQEPRSLTSEIDKKAAAEIKEKIADEAANSKNIKSKNVVPVTSLPEIKVDASSDTSSIPDVRIISDKPAISSSDKIVPTSAPQAMDSANANIGANNSANTSARASSSAASDGSTLPSLETMKTMKPSRYSDRYREFESQ